MKKEVIYVSSALIVILILLAVFLIPVGDQRFTGFAVIGEYTTEADCVGAGYIWVNLTNESCTTIPDCVECVEGCLSEREVCEPDCVTEYTEVLCEEGCEQSCGENETECVDCEPDCVTEYTEVLCEEGCVLEEDLCSEECQETCQICETIITGGECVGDVCDADHLTLCDNQLDCEDPTIGGGYWYGGVCNAEAECIPKTSCGSSCGDISDGCGGTLNCGACETACVEDWECDSWSGCVDGKKTRTCKDLNDCGTEEYKPAEVKSCEEKEPAGSSVDDILKEMEEQGILEGSQEQPSSQEQSALTGGAVEQINLSECAGCMLDEKCYRFNKRKNNTYCTEYGTWLPQKDINQTCSENFECESRNCDDGQCEEFNLLKAIIDWFRNLFKGSGSLDNNETANSSEINSIG